MTDFVARVPDQWLLLSICQRHPQGITWERLTEIACGPNWTTGEQNEVGNRMLDHEHAGRVRKLGGMHGGITYVTAPMAKE